MVEAVTSGSALEKADLQAGDLLLGWRRSSHTSADLEEEGEIASILDWLALKVEQAPRGTVELIGERQREPKRFKVPLGSWEVEVRPAMPGKMLELYRRGKGLIAGGQAHEGVNEWWRLVEMAGREEHWPLPCWLSLRIGEVLAEARKLEDAQAAYEMALAEARDPHSQGVVWEALGKSLEQQSRFEEAEEAYLAALRLWDTIWGESLYVARGKYRLGRLERLAGHLEPALELLEDAREIQQRLAPGTLELAASLNDLGIVTWQRGDLNTAESYYQQALAIRERLAPESLDVAGSLNNLGGLAFARGNLAVASEYYLRSLLIKVQRKPGSLTAAMSLSNMGAVVAERADLAAADQHFQQALAIQEQLAPESLHVARSLTNLGVVAWERGELATAAAYHRRALAIQQRLVPESLDVARSLSNLGAVALDRGDLAMALKHHHRALEIREHLAPGGLDVAITLNDLGLVASDREDLEQAARFHQRALAIRERLAPQSLEVARSLGHLGVVAFERGDLRAATAHGQRALAIAGRLAPGSKLEAETLQTLGFVFREAGQPELAMQHFYRMIQVMEAQIERLGGSRDAKASFRASRGSVYQEALRLHLELEQAEEAFHLLERSRAQSFLALLAERDLVFSADIPTKLDRERRSLAVQYDRNLQELAELSPEKDAEAIEELQNEQRRLRRKRDEVALEIQRTSPRLASIQYPQALNLEEVRDVLDPGTVMLSFSVGDDRTEVFVVSRGEDLEVETLPLDEETLRRQVERLRRVVPDTRPGLQGVSHRRASFEQEAQSLYTKLLQPVSARIEKGERLLIVPDGPLHALPWGALIRPTGSGHSAQSWEYLVEWKPLHITLSATVYAELKHFRSRESDPGATLPRLAAFGDPLYPEHLARANPESIADPRVRSAATRGFGFQQLPATRIEVEGISGLFGAGARAYLGAEATEERSKAIDRQIRYLHFATHGTLDERFPLNSAVALTIPESFGEDRDNGLLQVWEIFEQLRLDAELVVLSSCESALGKELGGEGLIGLTRAFQYAGARSVVASLWQVADVATAELMIRFYRHLQTGKPKDLALQAAQTELIRGPIEVGDGQGERIERDASAPYYWAAFQIYGDWQ